MCLALLPISAFAQTSAALFMLGGGRLLKLGDTPHTIESLDKLIDLYEAWDKSEKAKEWRAKLPKTEAAKQ